MAFIDEYKVREIKEATRIEDVIGKYVQLKKSGVSLVGVCPFHGGKSFNVSVVKQMYKCFGCGKVGNAITYLMEAQNKTYPEALKMLADQFNVNL